MNEELDPQEGMEAEESVESTPVEIDMDALLSDPDLANVLADPAQLKELISKGSDYTAKTQALADERRQIEAKLEYANAYEELLAITNDPVQRQEFAQRLLGQDTGTTSGIDTSYMTETELALHQQIQTLQSQLSQIQPFIQGSVQQQRLQEATSKAAELYKVEVSPADLQAAMKQLGTDNPLHAAAHLAASRPTPVQKPTTVASHGQRASTLDEPESGSDIFNQLMNHGNRVRGK
jgi:hypothetical protein